MSDYEKGWLALTELLDAGSSWSGHERDVAYLNLGQGRFVDSSFVAGFDALSDGRAVVSVDWDRDGDLDLWVRSRTGPTLRYLENRSAPGRYLELKLEGTEANRDALGTLVYLQTNQRTRISTVLAGDGYLSQSSALVHFALSAREEVEHLELRWPGGDVQAHPVPAELGRLHCVQGAAAWVPMGPETARAPELPEQPAVQASPSRTVLREPLRLAPELLRAWLGDQVSGAGIFDRPQLLVWWSPDDEASIRTLEQLARGTDQLWSVGLTIRAFSIADVDEEQHAERAAAAFAQRVLPAFGERSYSTRLATPADRGPLAFLLDEILGLGSPSAACALLVARDGNLRIIYRGSVTTQELAQDVRIHAIEPPPAQLQATFPGRWFYGMRRDLSRFADGLEALGRHGDATFYAALNLMRRPRAGASPK